MGMGKLVDRTDRTLGELAKPSGLGSAEMGCPIAFDPRLV
jgi:hypothetical protein